MNIKPTCFELLELRLLQQRRGECTDGRNPLRLALGVIFSVAILIGVASSLPEMSTLDQVSPLSLVILLGAVFICHGVTVAWIVSSDKKTTTARISELELIVANARRKDGGQPERLYNQGSGR